MEKLSSTVDFARVDGMLEASYMNATYPAAVGVARGIASNAKGTTEVSLNNEHQPSPVVRSHSDTDAKIYRTSALTRAGSVISYRVAKSWDLLDSATEAPIGDLNQQQNQAQAQISDCAIISPFKQKQRCVVPTAVVKYDQEGGITPDYRIVMADRLIQLAFDTIITARNHMCEDEHTNFVQSQQYINFIDNFTNYLNVFPDANEKPPVGDDRVVPAHEVETSTAIVLDNASTTTPDKRFYFIDPFFSGSRDLPIGYQVEEVSKSWHYLDTSIDTWLRTHAYERSSNLDVMRYASQVLAMDVVRFYQQNTTMSVDCPIVVSNPYVSGNKWVLEHQQFNKRLRFLLALTNIDRVKIKMQRENTYSLSLNFTRVDPHNDTISVVDFLDGVWSVNISSFSYNTFELFFNVELSQENIKVSYIFAGEKSTTNQPMSVVIKGEDLDEPTTLIYQSGDFDYRVSKVSRYAYNIRIKGSYEPKLGTMDYKKKNSRYEQQRLLNSGDVELNPGPDWFSIPQDQMKEVKEIARSLENTMKKTSDEVSNTLKDVISRLEKLVEPTKQMMLDKIVCAISTLYLLYTAEDMMTRVAILAISRTTYNLLGDTASLLLNHWCLTTQDAETNTSLLDQVRGIQLESVVTDVAGAIVDFFRSITGWRLPHSVIEWVSMTKLVDTLLRLPHSFASFVKLMIKFFTYLIDGAWKWLFGSPFSSDGKWHAAREVLDEWMSDVQAASTEPAHTWVTDEGYAKLKDLVDAGETMLRSQSNRDLARGLRDTYNKIRPVYDNLTLMRKIPTTRVRPVVIMLTGASGVGKSTLIDYLCSVINQKLEVKYPTQALKYVHDANADDFFNGYYGQMCYVGDEMFSVADANLVEQECIRFFNMVNVATMMTNQADVELKGKVPFISPFMICTTNRTNFSNDQGFNRTDGNAFLRRIDFLLRVRRAFPAQTDVVDAAQWLFSKCDIHGNPQGSEFSFDALLNEIMGVYQQHIAEYQRIAKHVDGTMDRVEFPIGKFAQKLMDYGIEVKISETVQLQAEEMTELSLENDVKKPLDRIVDANSGIVHNWNRQAPKQWLQNFGRMCSIYAWNAGHHIKLAIPQAIDRLKSVSRNTNSNMKLLKILTATVVSGTLLFAMHRWYKSTKTGLCEECSVENKVCCSKCEKVFDLEESGEASNWGKSKKQKKPIEIKRKWTKHEQAQQASDLEMSEEFIFYDESKDLDHPHNQVAGCYPLHMREFLCMKHCKQVGSVWFVKRGEGILPPYGFGKNDRPYFVQMEKEERVEIGDAPRPEIKEYEGPAAKFLKAHCENAFGTIHRVGEKAQSAKVWYLDGKTFIVNSHILEGAHSETKFYIRVNGKEYMADGSSFDVYCPEGSDIAVVICSKDKVIQGIPSTVKYLPLKKDLLPAYENVYTVRLTENGLKVVSVGLCTVYGTDFLSDKAYDGQLTYRGPTWSNPGDCGSPYVAEVNGQPIILGFHFAKAKDSARLIGVCVGDFLQNKDLLEETVKNAEPVVKESIELQGLNVPNEVFVRRIENPKDRPHLPTTTKILPVNESDPYLIEMAGGDDRRIPAILKPIDGNSPAENAIKKFCVLDYPIDKFDRSYPIEIKDDGILTWEESAFGCPKGSTGWRSMVLPLDMTTSPGYNWRGNKRGKSGLFPRDKDQNRYISEQLMKACVNLEQDLEVGPVHQYVFDVLKDELRSRAKVMSYNTRIVSVLNVEFSMVMRRYCSSIINSLFMDNRIAVGINPHSTQWKKLHHQLKFDTKPDWVTYCGDFSGFDRTISDDYIRSFFDRGGKIPHKVRKIRQNIAESVINITHLMADVEYKGHGNPSGMPATTALNSWVNACVITSFFEKWGLHVGLDYEFVVYGDDSVVRFSPDVVKTLVETNSGLVLLRDNLHTLKTLSGKDRVKNRYHKEIRLIETFLDTRESNLLLIQDYEADCRDSELVGWDRAGIKKPKLNEYPEFERLLEAHASSFGFKLTADKNGACTFLKRGFVPMEERGAKIVLAPLPKSVIADMVLWYRRSQNMSKYQACKERAGMALVEAFHHGEKFYNEFLPHIKHMLEPRDCITWTEQLGRYIRGELSDVFEVPEIGSMVSWVKRMHATKPSLKECYSTKTWDMRGYIMLESDVEPQVDNQVDVNEVQHSITGELPQPVDRQVDQARFVDVAQVDDTTPPSAKQGSAFEASDYMTQLTRLYLLADVNWSSSDTSAKTLFKGHFPYDLFRQFRIADILSRFAYFKADVEVQVRLNCNRFQYGALVGQYLPYAPEDTICGNNNKDDAFTSWNIVKSDTEYGFGANRWGNIVDMYNNEHMVVSCQNNPTVTMMLRTVIPYDMCNVAQCMPNLNGQTRKPYRYFANLFSTFWLQVAVPLYDVSGTTNSNCHVQVLARFVNPTVSVNTPNIYWGNVPNDMGAVQLENDVGENMLHCIGSMIKDKIPFARPVIDTVKTVGKALGWSKPSQDSVVNVYASQTRDTTTCGSDNALATRLGQYSDTYLTDKVDMGVCDTSIQSLASREHLVYMDNFNSTASVGQRLCVLPCMPMPTKYLPFGAHQVFGWKFLCGFFPYMNAFFSYWRADIKVRIKFYCSAYHQCRVLAIWTPYVPGDRSPLTDYGDLISVQVNIVDGEIDMYLEVPWAQVYESKNTWPFCGGAISYDNSGDIVKYQSCTNGFISLYVLNPPVSALTNPTAPIIYQVFYSYDNAHLYHFTGTNNLVEGCSSSGFFTADTTKTIDPRLGITLESQTDEIKDWLELGKRYAKTKLSSYWVSQQDSSAKPFVGGTYVTPSTFPMPLYNWALLCQATKPAAGSLAYIMMCQMRGLGNCPDDGGMGDSEVYGIYTTYNPWTKKDGAMVSTSWHNPFYAYFGMYRFWRGSMRYKLAKTDVAYATCTKLTTFNVDQQDVHYMGAGVSSNDENTWPYNEVEVPYYSNFRFNNLWTSTPYMMEEASFNALCMKADSQSKVYYMAIGDDFQLGGLCSPPPLCSMRLSSSPMVGVTIAQPS